MRMSKVVKVLTVRRDFLQLKLDNWVGEKVGGYGFINKEKIAIEAAIALCQEEANKRMVQVMSMGEEA